MSSSSQILQCQTIAKHALENVVALGTRLYGYQVNSHNTRLQYNPLFIRLASGKSYGDSGNIKDVGDGHALNFPRMYSKLFQTLIGENVTPSLVNTSVPVVKQTASAVEIAPSIMLINSVNALQYLYNSDSDYFKGNSGKGKSWTVSSMSDDMIPFLWKEYKDKFQLTNMNFYVRINPVDLANHRKLITSYADIKCQKTQYNGTDFITTNYSCPENPTNHKLILTRPRIPKPRSGLEDSVARDFILVGNENIGFEIKVMLEYERNAQDFSCDAMRTFTHQIKTITGTMTKTAPVTVNALVNGESKNLLDTALKRTSCDTHGSNYNDVTIDLNFNGFMGSNHQVGNMLFCQGVSACRSYGNGSYGSCRVQKSRWQRCHEFKFPGQTGATTSKLLSGSRDSKLQLTFNDLAENRRYDLYVAESSLLELSRIKRVSRFYTDAKRPEILDRNVADGDVGEPSDGSGGRNYNGPRTSWSKPSGSTGRWLQCNTGDVDFNADSIDQFTHNLEGCDMASSRQDGSGTSSDTTGNITAQSSQGKFCQGRLTSISHGRQTITFTPKDVCGSGASKDLVWDTDLPSSFSTQDFSSDPFWLYSTQKTAYPINTVLPAANTAGRFPKHYSVDCFENQYCEGTRTDGNSGAIACKFTTHDSASDHDGCNPRDVDVKYYHVCGGTGDEDTKWSVYAPHTKSCKNVQCEPALICCDGFRNQCGTVSKHKCERNTYSNSCSHPKGGGRSQQDSGSGCPPLGLYNCHYNIPCEATTPFATTGPASACVGKRQSNSCSFSLSGTCDAIAATGHYENRPSRAGRCIIRGQDVGSCSVNVSPYCETGHNEDYDCNCRTVGGVRTCSTCTRWVCDDTDYILSDGSCSRTFSGSCGVPSGGCPRLGVGGGNLSQERCSVDRPSACGTTCNSSTTCCSGDSYPSNPNCSCDPRTACCTSCNYPANPNCACCSSTTCCPGDSYPSNPKCLCDSNTACCPGDAYPSNRHCTPTTTTTTTTSGTSNTTTTTSGPTSSTTTTIGSTSSTTTTTSGSQAQCDNPHPYNCTTGTSRNQSETIASNGNTHYKWECVQGSSVATCFKSRTGTTAWGCGSARCTCENAIVAKCGDDDTDDHYKWECRGPSGTTPLKTTSCQKAKPVEIGQCGTNKNTCSVGEFHPDPGPNDNEWRWTCRNKPHTGEKLCRKRKPTPTTTTMRSGPRGCDLTGTNRCHSGTLVDVVDARFCWVGQWQCVDVDRTYHCCISAGMTVDGQCGNSFRYHCLNGSREDAGETSTHYTWYCAGRNGGSRSPQCSMSK